MKNLQEMNQCKFKNLKDTDGPKGIFNLNLKIKQGSQLQGEKSCNFYEKPRSKPGIAFFVKNTALWAPRTPNSGMENRISEQNFYLTLIYMLIIDRKNEENLHSAVFSAYLGTLG
jgi:hypothetical protein